MTDEAATARDSDDDSPAAEAGDDASGADLRALHRAIESTQTILTALILAFVFRAFFVEAFVIPTGSMAESLLGVHGTALCPYCGWEYDYGPAAPSTGPLESFRAPAQLYCPNCHRWTTLELERVAPRAGDRILAHKWPYLFGGLLGPRRWDVILFRDPANPMQNYIKRLVGLPGETIEIIDGDVYIDGRVARKTPAAQSVLWFIVFDQNYFPHGAAGRPARAPWVAQQRRADAAPGWYGLDTRLVLYGGLDDTPRSIVFDPQAAGQYLLDVYGYDNGTTTAYVRDVRLVAEVTVRHGDGWYAWELTRAPYRFTARLDSDGTATLLMRSDEDGQDVVLESRRSPALVAGRPVVVEFAHLDNRVYLSLDGRELLATTDAQYDPSPGAHRRTRADRPVQLRITASALALELRGLRIDRDVYYTYRGSHTLRAFAGSPFKLGADEYFVLGDNSPHSADSREWNRRGRHLPDDYRLGTVPGDQIVGRAFFVYLPGLLPLDERGRWRIPDIGRVRFIR